MSGWPGDARRERTTFGGLSRGELMARVRGAGNKSTEQRLLVLLRSAGLTGWRRRQPMPGRPDFVWPKARVAVFVDGCFWHGHDCGRNVTPKTNARAWREKIQRNHARDRRVDRTLRRGGWSVIRIWECVLPRDPERCIARIRSRVEKSYSR